jgi:hypothetical protein
MPEIITNREEFYFDDLPPEVKDYKYLEYLILKEASGERVSMKQFTQKEIHKIVRRLVLDDRLHGNCVNDICVWSQLKPKGRDRLENLEKTYGIRI